MRPSNLEWRAAGLRLRNRMRQMRMGAARREISEDVWRKRTGEAWVEGYWTDVDSPRRECLVRTLRSTFADPESVLELGCNAGPNLRRIWAEFPGCRLSGFDINEEAIVGARLRFAHAGIPVDLAVGSFYDVLPTIATKSCELVVSSYALAYVPPANLSAVMNDVLRIASQGLVLVEPVALDGDRRPGVLTVPWYDWRHDYRDVLAGLGISGDRLAVYDLPEPGAPDSGLVTVDLR